MKFAKALGILFAVSFLTLMITDEPGIIRGLAVISIWLVIIINLWVIFSYLVHKTWDGFK